MERFSDCILLGRHLVSVVSTFGEISPRAENPVAL